MSRNNNATVDWQAAHPICLRCPLAECVYDAGQEVRSVRQLRDLKSLAQCPMEYAVQFEVPLSWAARIAVNCTAGDVIHLDYYRKTVDGIANGMGPFLRELLADEPIRP